MPDAGAAAGRSTASDAQVLEQAAEWFAALGADSADDDTHQRWRLWLNQDPRHATAWQRVEAMGRRFERLPHGIDKRAALHALDRVDGRRRAVKALAVAGLGALPAWYVWQREPWLAWTADHLTAVGERRELRLEDGTQLWLNTDTALNVEFDDQARRVRLLKGEVLVETAGDQRPAARPFDLTVPGGSLRPLGTRFSVRLDAPGCRLAVFEGRVQVQSRGEAEAQIVEAGRQIAFDARHIGTSQPAAASLASWARGLLTVDNMRLGDFVAELARYQPGHLACAPEVAELRLVGVFPLADIDQIYAALERSLPVRVSRPMPWWVSVGAR